LKRHEAALSALTAAKAKHGMALESLTKAEVDLADATEKLAAFDSPSADDVVRLQEEKNTALSDELAKRGSNILLQQARDAAVATFNNVDALWKMSKARIDDAEKTIASCKADLDSIEFNNALVKKLRSLRPLVADQLWNTVLTSVSVMFSQMRGEASIVTKGKDGFRVNGQAVESLSGSTLDLLGLALRSALLRTFVPHCDLLILDEPAAAMDQSRTEAMMGFIKTAGFGQTILITHESVSEAVCDNILEI
jgi:DNA repair exonuclease SbcCD ATPase subunit